uniref:hypothetical protein n=1 Tax=uncultured Halomonas sp. TaxID=173971 RepID=UPI00261BDAE8|nr:hypothetical protein [uncultured Halomonas sp.]
MKRHIPILGALFFASLLLATPALAMDSIMIERKGQDISAPLSTAPADSSAMEAHVDVLQFARDATK